MTRIVMMRKSNLLVVTAVALALALAGCADAQNNPKTTGGAIIGGIGGALLGSMFGKGKGQLVAVGLGTLAGAMVGSEVGKTLDAADRAQIDRAEKRATTAPIGQTISWNNPDSGNSGSITPVRDGNHLDGRYCREFQQTIEVGGKLEKGYGTACRQPDGSWQIMN
ncbi:RT0821/Lpp0805 family surface protein [Sneathiella sp.]|uniref:RT0821/Lpp0805 family surface protein n=1 Tax=Sneathiella sp. TaxID=1964365 RepID=UPI00261FBA98|nr:RT0821/Lpp0805 family surface protein [Sneathiella sp.]MDF2367612.1 RT0821/Lpp0805 family surface protein [Sneathiella sp.]